MDQVRGLVVCWYDSVLSGYVHEQAFRPSLLRAPERIHPNTYVYTISHELAVYFALCASEG